MSAVIGPGADEAAPGPAALLTMLAPPPLLCTPMTTPPLLALAAVRSWLTGLLCPCPTASIPIPSCSIRAFTSAMMAAKFMPGVQLLLKVTQPSWVHPSAPLALL